MQEHLTASEIIKKKILENFFAYLKLYIPVQSNFLTHIYKRYQCLDSGNIVLHFAKETHQAILRKKDYDLNYDLSFEKFWQNHSEVITQHSAIINIAKNIDIPKETARRKLGELIKQKVLSKKKNKIIWLPTDEYQKDYNIVVADEIRQLAKLTHFITSMTNLSFSIDEIENEYKKKFSFYWFHYLDLQLKWMKLWKAQTKDLEVAMLYMQIGAYLSSRVNEIVTHDELFSNPDIIKRPNSKNMNVSLSATSLSDITGIPRATCIRKLNQMVGRKILTQDEKTKRYYINPESLNKKVVSKELVENMQGLFSEFYLIVIKALCSNKTN